nr:unnamed protein product [Callosobruchus chinensis]
MSVFEDTLGIVSVSSDVIICAGDLNINLYDMNSVQTSNLNCIFDTFHLLQVINAPTRITSNTATLINVLMTSSDLSVLDCGTINTELSDHQLIYCFLKKQGMTTPPKTIIIRDYKNLDIRRFQYDLARVPFFGIYDAEITPATAERSFSKLKLIKNYLRTSMGQERLSDISLLSIEAETLEKLKSSSAINDLINQVVEEYLKTIDEVSSIERISSDTNAKCLTEANLRGLMYSLICQCSRPGHYPYHTFLVDMSRHNTYLALFGSNDTRAVGTNQPGLVLPDKLVLDTDHVMLGDSLSDAHNEGHLSVDCFNDCCCGSRRWYIDHCCITTSCVPCLKPTKKN